MKSVRLISVAAFALLAMVISVGAAPEANATSQKNLNATLAALWTSVLETPSARNSYGAGGQQYACWNLDGTVAPLAPAGVNSCTVKPDTKLFVAGSTYECSTFPGHHPDYGTTGAELRACARAHDSIKPTVTLDGRALQLTEAKTPVLRITLPAGNILGLPAGTKGRSVGHGWVALLQPLSPGTHTIVISSGTPPPIRTKIIVKPCDKYHSGS